VRIGGLKGFGDGVMGASTAMFYERFLHTGGFGIWRDIFPIAARDIKDVRVVTTVLGGRVVHQAAAAPR
jgi:hypothetical protein